MFTETGSQFLFLNSAIAYVQKFKLADQPGRFKGVEQLKILPECLIFRDPVIHNRAWASGCFALESCDCCRISLVWACLKSLKN